MWKGDFDFAGRLESQVSHGGNKKTQNFLFDYSKYNTRWASSPEIALCLGEYITRVSQAYRDVKGDGKIILVAHSMGGLAALYSTDTTLYSNDKEFPSSANVAGIITLDTPYLGAYAGGGWNPFDISNDVGRIKEIKAAGLRISEWFPPANTDALNCLGIHYRGSAIPPPCMAELPPPLPDGVPLTQIAGNITVERTVFGLLNYNLPLNSDGAVPLDSQIGYLKIASALPKGGGVDVRSDIVNCSVKTGDLQSEARLAGLSGGLVSSLLSTSGATLVNDYIILDRIDTSPAPNSQDATRFAQALILAGLANLKADCSHSHIYHSQSALNKTTEAVDRYLDIARTGSIAQGQVDANEYTTGRANEVAFITPSGNIACIISGGAELTGTGSYTACLVKEHSWPSDPRPIADICPESLAWAEDIVEMASVGVSAGSCTGDNPTSPARVILPYGKSLVAGDIFCSVADDTGVTCVDSSIGKSFTVSRAELIRDAAPDWPRITAPGGTCPLEAQLRSTLRTSGGQVIICENSDATLYVAAFDPSNFIVAEPITLTGPAETVGESICVTGAATAIEIDAQICMSRVQVVMTGYRLGELDAPVEQVAENSPFLPEG